MVQCDMFDFIFAIELFCFLYGGVFMINMSKMIKKSVCVGLALSFFCGQAFLLNAQKPGYNPAMRIVTKENSPRAIPPAICSPHYSPVKKSPLCMPTPPAAWCVKDDGFGFEGAASELEPLLEKVLREERELLLYKTASCSELYAFIEDYLWISGSFRDGFYCNFKSTLCKTSGLFGTFDAAITHLFTYHLDIPERLPEFMDFLSKFQ